MFMINKLASLDFSFATYTTLIHDIDKVLYYPSTTVFHKVTSLLDTFQSVSHHLHYSKIQILHLVYFSILISQYLFSLTPTPPIFSILTSTVFWIRLLSLLIHFSFYLECFSPSNSLANIQSSFAPLQTPLLAKVFSDHISILPPKQT